MSVHIHVDTSDATRELDRLGDAPSTAALLRLEAILTAQFQATQQVVHIVTGSLRRSGKVDSRLRNGEWSGDISYGGAAPGAVHDPVRYAELEQQRAPGGRFYRSERGFIPGADAEGRISVMHDFMAPAARFEHQYAEAILAFLRGDA